MNLAARIRRPSQTALRSNASTRSIYYFDIVHDYPEMGGVVEFSRILFRQLRTYYGPRLVSVREMTAVMGCAHADMLYLDRERRVAEILTAVDPASVFFFPNFQSPVARRADGGGPAVVNVIHDVQFAFLTELFPAERRRWLHETFAETKQNADRIVFISQSTQRDFISLFGKPRRHTIIYNPVEIGEGGGAAARDDETPFLLASFHHHPHKNFSGLLSLFAAVAERVEGLTLVVTGHGRERLDQDIASLPQAARSRVRHLGYVPRQDLDGLYRRARAFITLSRFEGFNLSAAEAACHGAPLILSDLPVHRELFGAQACFVDLAASCDESAGKVAAYLSDRRPPRTWRFRSICLPSKVGAAYVRIIESVNRRSSQSEIRPPSALATRP